MTVTSQDLLVACFYSDMKKREMCLPSNCVTNSITYSWMKEVVNNYGQTERQMQREDHRQDLFSHFCCLYHHLFNNSGQSEFRRREGEKMTGELVGSGMPASNS